MSEPSSSNDESRRVSELVNQFVAKRKSGEPAKIDDWVAQHPDLGGSLRRELRRIEMLFVARDDEDLTHREEIDPEITVFEGGEQTDEADLGFETNSQKASEPYRLKIACPDCGASLEVNADTPWTNIDCDQCHALFSLVGTEEQDDTALTHVGHFELLDRLGVGAFGTVWRARDIELERFVAIKLPRKGLLTSSEAKHFLREARAAAQIRHPNIVRVLEIGRFQGRVFIASEYVQGESLANLITDRRLTIRGAAELIAKLAEALQVAHDAGVIHRDLKPGNILMDQNSQPHITDFGLAKRDSADVTMTVDGAIMGTPAYMSPEQAAGDAHTSDGRSDIYSLGVMLFRLLTGELPFRGTTQILLQQVIHAEPPSPRKYNPLVSRDLETICSKCLQKSPAARYQTASQLAAELNSFLEGKPIVSRPVGRLTRTTRWCLRRKALSAALLGVMLVTLIGAITAVVLVLQADQANRVAMATTKQASRLRQQADAIQQKANRQMYASDLNRVQQAIDNGNRLEAMELLRRYIPETGKTDYRLFEWFYWWDVCNFGAIDAQTINTRIVCVDVAPDGQSVIFGDYDGNIYRAAAGLATPQPFPNRHDTRISDICFSNDGTQVFSCSDDGWLKSWNSRSLELIAEQQLDGPAWFVKQWHEGDWLVIGTEDENQVTVSIFAIDQQNSANGQAARGHSSPSKLGRLIDQFSVKGRFPSLTLSPDGQHVVVANYSQDGELLLRDVVAQKNVWVKGEQNGFDDAVFSADGKQLIVCKERVPAAGERRLDRAVFLVIDVQSGTVAKTVPRRQGVLGIGAITLTSAQQLVTANGEGSLDIYNASTLVHEGTFAGHQKRVMDVGLNPEGNLLFSVSDDGSIRTWDLKARTQPQVFKPGGAISAIAFSHDDQEMALALPGRIVVLRAADLTEIESRDFEGTHVGALTFVDASSSIAFTGTRPNLEVATSRSTGMWLWDRVSHGVNEIIRFDDRSLSAVVDLGNGRLAVCEVFPTPWSLDRPARILCFKKEGGDYRLEREFGGRAQMSIASPASNTHHMSVANVAISPDGTMLVSGSRDRSTKIWNLDTGEMLYSKSDNASVIPITFVAVSSRGIVAAGESNGTIQLWPLDDPHESRSFMAHNDFVSRLAFSPGGETLFSGGIDGTIKVWDVESGQLRSEFSMASDERTKTFALSHNGRCLASADDVGNLYLQWAVDENRKANSGDLPSDVTNQRPPTNLP